MATDTTVPRLHDTLPRQDEAYRPEKEDASRFQISLDMQADVRELSSTHASPADVLNLDGDRLSSSTSDPDRSAERAHSISISDDINQNRRDDSSVVSDLSQQEASGLNQVDVVPLATMSLPNNRPRSLAANLPDSTSLRFGGVRRNIAEVVDLDEVDNLPPFQRRRITRQPDVIDIGDDDDDEVAAEGVINEYDYDDSDYSELEDDDFDDVGGDNDDSISVGNSDDDGYSGNQDVLQWQKHKVVEEKPVESSTLLSDFNCVICFDQPEILMATPCGHMYCHECMYKALSSGSKATQTMGECSVCRRKVLYTRVIALELKLGDDELDQLEEVTSSDQAG
ncbi:hypothetical protein V1514DRAFT_333634 [Lipomyces japonicus]|uniref:uncharacterized protein n=1 Tax=Lipomyces japonicus TaxID=56871 RepID=UPI0034CE0472